jgi:hypothetical protein
MNGDRIKIVESNIEISGSFGRLCVAIFFLDQFSGIVVEKCSWYEPSLGKSHVVLTQTET